MTRKCGCPFLREGRAHEADSCKPCAGDFLGGVALADIPVDDDQQLTQKTLTQTTTTSTVPVQQNNNKGQGGINCATHQGQKGTTQNNTAQPNTGDRQYRGSTI